MFMFARHSNATYDKVSVHSICKTKAFRKLIQCEFDERWRIEIFLNISTLSVCVCLFAFMLFYCLNAECFPVHVSIVSVFSVADEKFQELLFINTQNQLTVYDSGNDWMIFASILLFTQARVSIQINI